MPDTELTVSHPIVITVAVDGLDFNEVVAEIRRAAAQACGEILGCVLRAVCQEVRTYLDRHEALLWTHREWERRTTVRKMGSGVIEKTIETQINRRMKKQGMSWSAPGARRLAKLRVLYPDRPRWEAFWARSLSETGQHTPGDPTAEVS